MSHIIVVAVDGSPPGDRAVELLAGYAGEPSQADALAINVQTRPLAIWPEASIDVRSIEDALMATGREIANRAAARLRAAGLNAESVVRLGFPAEAIGREAQSRGAALVVVGTRGHGAVRGFALGSVAMRVAHAGPVPVCLVRPEAKLPAELGRRLRVMLPLDGSDTALRAARFLASARGWMGELDVQIVYVQQPLTVLEAVLPPHNDVMKQWSTEAGEAAARPARELLAKEGIRNHLHLTVGDPAEEIPHLASETGCELVVMGTRGRGAGHHALIGSVALKVVAHAAMPVIVVK
jgi:nucleotide-binding universal stress UspA family protein